MSLELLKDSIQINNIVENLSSQTIISNDIIVPDVKADVSSIVFIESEALVEDTQILEETVELRGTLLYKILYITDDTFRSIKSITTKIAFSHSENVKNITKDMVYKIKADVEHTEYQILNGRKILVRSLINFSGKVTNEFEHEFITDLNLKDSVEVLKESLRVNCSLGSDSKNFAITQELEVPSGNLPIKEILLSNAKILNTQTKLLDNRAFIQGDINVKTLYIAEDEQENIYSIEHVIPFTQTIDINGIKESCTCNIDYKIVDSSFEEAEDSYGELRKINTEILINLDIESFYEKEIELIKDAYSLNSRINIGKKPLKISTLSNQINKEIVLKDTISLFNTNGINKILEVFSKPLLYEVRNSNNQIIIEGIVKNHILYVSEDANVPLHCHEFELPFTKNLDINSTITEGSELQITPSMQYCNYTLTSSQEIEIREAIDIGIKIINSSDIHLTDLITESAEDDDRGTREIPSLLIYFSQSGDTLWDIAKKYCTTTEVIKDINSLNENDSIFPGQQIIIPGKAV